MAGVTYKQSYRGKRGETIKGDLITIEGDLDGDFNFEGKVIVLGSILPGANIKGKGDLEVRGNIGENAQVVVRSLGVASGIGLFQVGGTVQKNAKVFADFIKLNKVDAAQVVSYKSATIGEVLPDSRIFAEDGNVVVRSNVGDRSQIKCFNNGSFYANTMGENVTIEVNNGLVAIRNDKDPNDQGISPTAKIIVNNGEVNSGRIRGNPVISAPLIFTTYYDKNASFADKVNRPPSLPPSFGKEKPKTNQQSSSSSHAAPRPEDERPPKAETSAVPITYNTRIADSLLPGELRNRIMRIKESNTKLKNSQPSSSRQAPPQVQTTYDQSQEIDMGKIFQDALNKYVEFNDAIKNGEQPRAVVTRGHPAGLMTKWRHTEGEKERLLRVAAKFQDYEKPSQFDTLRRILLEDKSKSPEKSNTHSFVNYLMDELLRCTNTPSFSIANYTQQQRQQIFDSLLEKLGPNSDPENNNTPRMT